MVKLINYIKRLIKLEPEKHVKYLYLIVFVLLVINFLLQVQIRNSNHMFYDQIDFTNREIEKGFDNLNNYTMETRTMVTVDGYAISQLSDDNYYIINQIESVMDQERIRWVKENNLAEYDWDSVIGCQLWRKMDRRTRRVYEDKIIVDVPNLGDEFNIRYNVDGTIDCFNASENVNCKEWLCLEYEND